MTAPTLRQSAYGITQAHTASILPLWISAMLVIGAVLMALGGVIALIHPAMLVPPGSVISDAVRVYAGYFAARNLTLAAILVIALALRARSVLSTLTMLTGFIQIFDAVLDLYEKRFPVAVGVVLFAIALFLAAARLSGKPFWRISAWRGGTVTQHFL